MKIRIDNLPYFALDIDFDCPLEAEIEGDIVRDFENFVEKFDPYGRASSIDDCPDKVEVKKDDCD